MDEQHNDRFLKDILQNSRMEITNPHFENRMMQKILAQDKKRRTIKNLYLYAVIFLSVDAILFTFYKLLKFEPGGNALQSLPKASLLTRSVESFLNHNSWIIAAFGVILLFSIISWAGSGLGSPRIRHT